MVTVMIARAGRSLISEFRPSGRLGRRIGNLFVAAGSPRNPLAMTDGGIRRAHYAFWMLVALT